MRFLIHLAIIIATGSVHAELPFLSGPEPEAPQTSVSENSVEHRALQGIIRYVGSHYQSCAPLLNTSVSAVSAMQSGQQDGIAHQTSQCTDRRGADFRYLTGGILRGRDGEIDSFRRVWCSGATGGTMSAAGLNFTQNQTDPFYSPTTLEVYSLSQQPNSCLYNPEISVQSSLRPGDFLNTSANHLVQVYEVGDDPLGLQQIQNASLCSSISKANFDFTYVHASSTNVQSGIHFQQAKDSTSKCITDLVRATQALCREMFANNTQSGQLPVATYGNGYTGHTSHFSLLRHHGDQKEGCTREPTPVRGESCLADSCYQAVNERILPGHNSTQPNIENLFVDGQSGSNQDSSL